MIFILIFALIRFNLNIGFTACVENDLISTDHLYFVWKMLVFQFPNILYINVYSVCSNDQPLALLILCNTKQ